MLKAEKCAGDEPPRKKSHKGHSGHHGPTLDGEKLNERVRSTRKRRPAESSKSLSRDPIIEPDQFGRHASKSNKGKLHI